MKLIVKNIEQILTSELKAHFKDYSPTKVAIRYDANSRNSGIADIEIPDDAMGKKAIDQLNGSKIGEFTIGVMSADDFAKGMHTAPSQVPLPQTAPHLHPPKKRFPYAFVKRPKPTKKAPDALHDALQKDRFDIAFDITWTTLTATALNPSIDEGAPESSPPESSQGEYAGYNKRWLMTEDGRLTISPFTVKSAIANGVANLLGGCYRVISKVEGHPDPSKIKEGNYYYTGKYKRYRVARDMSKPAIVKSIEDDVIEKNGKQKKIKKVVLKPVKEFLLENDPPNCLTPISKQAYYGKSRRIRHKNILYSLREINGTAPNDNEIEIICYGQYKFGMNAELVFGSLDKYYSYRFYKFLPDSPITAEIDSINFEKSGILETKVYMGNYKNSNSGKIWYDNLTSLKKGDWIYYQHFKNNKVESIGQNFQFKALFCHEDTVPEGYEACHELGHLCPRCRLFGMTGETELKSPEPAVKSLKGRFKSAALVSDIQLKEESDHMTIPFQEGNTEKNKEVEIAIWQDQNGRICRSSPFPSNFCFLYWRPQNPTKEMLPAISTKSVKRRRRVGRAVAQRIKGTISTKSVKR